ncbi:MAG TPA: peroxiredoxin family protein [Tepidisphaeraceae bacterium]|nr:peroxiredoxin family protein [Tepidisphaeraceae bacterium]
MATTLTQLVSAPDVELPDHAGTLRRLSDRAGVGPTVVVFFRGHWCPYCRRYLTKLQANFARFAECNAAVVGISPEPAVTSRRLVAELGLSFTVLADVECTAIERYGVRNAFLSGSTILPHPAVFIVDDAGQIRFRSIDRNYKKRTTMRTIFAALAEVAGVPAAV